MARKPPFKDERGGVHYYPSKGAHEIYKGPNGGLKITHIRETGTGVLKQEFNYAPAAQRKKK